MTMLGHRSSYDVGFLWSVKLNLFSFNKILHLILKGPTVVCIMTWTIKVIGAMAFGLYSGDVVLGFFGASLRVTRLVFNSCGKI